MMLQLQFLLYSISKIVFYLFLIYTFLFESNKSCFAAHPLKSSKNTIKTDNEIKIKEFLQNFYLNGQYSSKSDLHLNDKVNAYESVWMLKSRVVFYVLHPLIRLLKLQNILDELHTTDFLANKNYLYEQIIQKIWLVSHYELGYSLEVSERIINKLAKAKCFEKISSLEKLLSIISEPIHLLNEESLQVLLNCSKYIEQLPYDNGFLPILDKVSFCEFLVISSIYNNKPNISKKYIEYIASNLSNGIKFRSIPVAWLYLILLDKKDYVAKEISKNKQKLYKEDLDILMSIIDPIYANLTSQTKKLILAMAISPKYIDLAIEILTNTLSKELSYQSLSKIKPFLLVLKQLYKVKNYHKEVMHLDKIIKTCYY